MRIRHCFPITIVITLLPHNAMSNGDGNCAPYPVGMTLGNVTLGNNNVMRGVSIAVGDPEQHFAFFPQWPLNNTFVYGIDGHCDDTWSAAGCESFRGGAYNESASSTEQDVSNPGSYLTENPPYPGFSWTAEDLILDEHTTLTNFPLGLPLADWGAQGYHPQAAIGLGRNSTILNALYNAGHIASRSWAMWWGRTSGGEEQDGSLVFGGFDRARVQEGKKNYTYALDYSNAECPSGMLITISDLALNFDNGTRASLFNETNRAMPACITPDAPVLMTMPRDPYFDRFEDISQRYTQDRSFGVYFYGLVYPNHARAYTGDLSITINSEYSVRIFDWELVVPNININKTTGALSANGETPELLINPLQLGNAGELPELGRQFLTRTYIMLNQDANTFTLFESRFDTSQDLVAIDEKNQQVDRFCAATNQKINFATIGSTSPVSGSGSSPSSNSTVADDASRDTSDSQPGLGDEGKASMHLSSGVIAGIVVGCAVGVTLVSAVLFFLRRRATKQENRHKSLVISRPMRPEARYIRNEPPNELAVHNLPPYNPQELHSVPISKPPIELP
ncbi:aspartic peptidase domain-containing protein [Aspergillus ambiguus]|uniref:aspartic peptidase domain-containing protein n=1 Tax=Aspergillus ambiguus TaxID=176160 RepID=UPI003CCDA604